jgi:GT2 family glycosyltransferase
LGLYESDLDIVSGAYMLENGEVTAYPQRLGPALNCRDVVNMTEPVKVHGVGFGFLAVKQGIFEQLTRPWFQSVEVTMTGDDGSEYTFPIMGEDISWCERVGRLGHDVWLDPSVKVTHHRMARLGWESVR